MNKHHHNPTYFLNGGGEMGQLVRSYDWNNSSLGVPENWPISLKTTLGVVLHSAFPMFLFWGADLLCFYNDAYRPSLGKDGRHPLIGAKAVDAWPDTWPFIGPLIEKVMRTGEAVWFEDQLVPIYRNGQMEDVYWTFSYGPAYGDDGLIAGVMVTCTETTEKVLSIEKLEHTRTELLGYFEQSPVAIATIAKEGLTFKLANNFYGELVGRTPEQLVGFPLMEALPELEGQGIEQLLQGVIDTGIPFRSHAFPVDLKRNNIIETVYVNLTYQPEYDIRGVVKGVMVVATDITEQVMAQKALADSKQRLLFAIDATELATWDYNPADNTFSGNDRLKELYGLADEPLFDLGAALSSIAEEERDGVIAAIQYALTPESGGKYDIQYTVIHPKTGQERIIKAKGLAQFDDSGKPLLFNGTLQDITTETLITRQLAVEIAEQKRLRQRAEASELQFRELIQAAPAGIGVFVGKDLIIENPNKTFIDIVGKGPEVEGLPLREAMPELITEGQAFLDILNEVYETGVPFISPGSLVKIVQNGVLNDNYYNISYTPLRNSSGEIYAILDIAIDVTAQIKAQQELAEKKKELDLAMEIGQLGSFRIDLRTQTAQFSESVQRWFHLEKTVATMDDISSQLHEEDREYVLSALKRSAAGEDNGHHSLTYRMKGNPSRVLHSFGQVQWENGDAVSLSGIIQDVTASFESRRQLEEAESNMRNAVNLAGLGTWVLDLSQESMYFSERYQEIFGLPADSHSFVQAARCVIPEDRERVLQHFEAAIKSGSDGRFDSEYKIRNATTGKMHVIHAVGQAHFNSSGEALKINGTVRDVTLERELQLALRSEVALRTAELAKTNAELERKHLEESLLNESLRQSNAELEQFAYIASHDLQEPIRKISVFMDLLERNLPETPNAKALDYMNRIKTSTHRMTSLIRDVLAFSRIKDETEQFSRVDLNEVLQIVVSDFELQIEHTQARLQIGMLPVIDAIPLQMVQLFSNLISNSLKYRKTDQSPVITLTAQAIELDPLTPGTSVEMPRTYYELTISDNGIGFQQEYVDKIFRIFQRLHGKTEYEGTGIGLAICLRIVQKHQGHITAEVGENGGAVFKIVLPSQVISE